MAIIKEKDFIELDYTGKTKEGIVFDTTVEQVAKDSNAYQANIKYKPAIVCIGEGHLLRALELQIIGKEPGRHTFEIKDTDGFGKKSAKLLKLVPMRAFKKQNLQPVPGMELNIDNMFGIVKSVSGGRVIVDFNHPLASKDLVYDVDIKRIVADDQEKVSGYLDLVQVKAKSVSVKEGRAVIEVENELPSELKDELSGKLKSMTGLKEIEFKV